MFQRLETLTMQVSKTALLGMGLLLAGSVMAFAGQSPKKPSRTIKPSSVRKPVTVSKSNARVVRAQMSRPSPPRSPDTLAALTDIIVIGKVTKVLAMRTTPVDCPPSEFWYGNHTVYSFHVEEYLLGKGADNIKIRHEGGEAAGLRYIQDDNPGLLVGERYLLFLVSSQNSPQVKKYGYLACSKGGKIYKAGDADELQLRHFQRGKIRIEDGVLVQATDDEHPLPPWRFESPGCDQLIGITEREAHDVIKKAIKDSIGMGRSTVYTDD